MKSSEEASERKAMEALLMRYSLQMALISSLSILRGRANAKERSE